MAEPIDKALRELNMSDKEAGRIGRALKDPVFASLLGDYARELRDPKAKQEAEEYLRQLEREERLEEVLGRGAVLVAPRPAFVVKALDMAGGTKLFINLCTSDKVDPAVCKRAIDAASGREGTQWNFPFALSSLRAGSDKAGADCRVCDATVHPTTVRAAAEQPRVKDLLVEAILERVEEREGSQLSRSYSCPKMKFKATEGAPQPPLVTVRAAAGGEPYVSATPQEPHHPGIQVLGSVPGAGSSQGRSSRRSSFKFPQPASAQGIGAPSMGGRPLAAGAASSSGAQGEQEPQYMVVHRGRVDLSEAWGDGGRGLQLESSRPKELVVRVELPGVESIQDIVLDLSSTELRLAVPGRYRLQLPLPHRVRDAKACAQLDKARQHLEVILPVEQPVRPVPSEPDVEELRQPVAVEQEKGGGEAGPGVVPADAEGYLDALAGGSIRELIRPSPARDASVTARGVAGAGAAEPASRQRWREVHATLDSLGSKNKEPGGPAASPEGTAPPPGPAAGAAVHPRCLEAPPAALTAGPQEPRLVFNLACPLAEELD